MKQHKRERRLPVELSKRCKGEEEKAELVQIILNAVPALDIYREIIEDKINKLNETKETDYEKASWSALQADRNGQKRALSDILKLFPRPEGE